MVTSHWVYCKCTFNLIFWRHAADCPVATERRSRPKTTLALAILDTKMAYPRTVWTYPYLCFVVLDMTPTGVWVLV